MILRDYQKQIVSDLYKKLKVKRSCLLVAPTGSGKTAMSAKAVMDALKTRRVYFVVHRDELVNQTIETLRKFGLDIPIGIIKAGHTKPTDERLLIASVQTLARRPDSMPSPEDVLFIDEAHTTSFFNACKKAIDCIDGGKVIGLTATPWRLKKGEGMSSIYEDFVLAPTPSELREMGFLADARTFFFPAIDTSNIPTLGGDYEMGSLERECISPQALNIVRSETMKKLGDRTAIAFCTTVNHAQALAGSFNQLGITAEVVIGETKIDERKKLYGDLRSGKLQVLCSVGVLTEGFDVPNIGLVIGTRPTQSKALNMQMIGRGLRICEGKEDCLILDFAGNTHRHGLVYDMTSEDMEPDRPCQNKKGDAPVKNCPKCKAVISAQVMECPECGYIFKEKEKQRDAISGELVEALSYSPKQKAYAQRFVNIYRPMVLEAMLKNYKVGKAAADFKRKVGNWPSKLMQALVFPRGQGAEKRFHNYLIKTEDKDSIDMTMRTFFGNGWRTQV